LTCDLLAAKAGSGQIPGLSWPPILFLGTKSPAFGRQSRLGGIFLAVFASKTVSRFPPTKLWRRIMDSRPRHEQRWPRKLREKIPRDRIPCQFGAGISPGTEFPANLAPEFPPELFSRPILLAGTPFPPGEAIMSRKKGPAAGYRGPEGGTAPEKRRPRGSESEGDHGLAGAGVAGAPPLAAAPLLAAASLGGSASGDSELSSASARSPRRRVDGLMRLASSSRPTHR